MDRGIRTIVLIGIALLTAATISLLRPVPVRGDGDDGAGAGSGSIGPCTVFPGSIFYAKVDTLPTTTSSEKQIDFLSEAYGTPNAALVDPQFAPGDLAATPGVHKGFEFTYLEVTAIATPVPRVTVVTLYDYF